MNAPTTTNQTANTVNDVVSVAGNTIVSVVEAMIIADVPALGFPVIKQIWEAFFSWIAAYFIRAAETGATFGVIDAQVATEVTTLSTALGALILAEKIGDAAQIKAAIQNYANAQSTLTHDDGSASNIN